MDVRYEGLSNESLIARIQANIAQIKVLDNKNDQQVSEELAIQSVLDFLDDPNRVPYAQLAPEQVDANPTDAQFNFFKRIIDNCLEADQTQRIVNFYQRYPNMAQRLLPNDLLLRLINQNFQRVLELKNVNEETLHEELAVNALIAFLENPQGNPLPSYLQLSPERTDANPSENALACFKNVIQICKTFSSDRKNLIIDNLQRLYPNIFKRVMDEIARKHIEEESNKPNPYKETLKNLMRDVVGQQEAASMLASLLTSQKKVIKNHVFLFVGPTGVGKTELAKAVAKTKKCFLTICMNVYQAETDFAKFFGAGPGLVGSMDKPFFAKKLDESKPLNIGKVDETQVYEVNNTVILFDEFEKAHEKIKQSLLTLLDEWVYTAEYTGQDQKNISIKYLFKDCIIINTSNLYQEEILQYFQDALPIAEIAENFKKLNSLQPTANSYSPELLGRMSVIPFGPIPRGEGYQKLVNKQLDKLMNSLSEEFHFKEFGMVRRDQILAIMENKLYGQGTDIRKLHEYFSVQTMKIFHQNHSTWGNSKDVKITFYPSEGKVYIKASLFISEFNRYHPVGNAIELP